MDDYVDKMIDYMYGEKPDIKEKIKRIRKLVIEMEKLCIQDGDFNVILNALDLLKEYYMNQVQVLKEKV